MQHFLETLGINLEENTFSLNTFLRVAVLVLVGVIVIRILMKLVDRMLERSKGLESLQVYIRSALQVGLWFLLALMVASSLNVDVTSIIALLSVAGLAVALALQNTLSNLAGGIMLLITKPFQVGHFVEADGISGTVSAIDLSYTTLVTPDNKEIYVPNSQLSATKIINYTALGTRRTNLLFCTSYKTPTPLVKQAIGEVLANIPQILDDPAPVVLLDEYKNSCIQYVVRVWASSADYWDVHYAILEQVRDAFDRHGVEVTYDHLNVHILEK